MRTTPYTERIRETLDDLGYHGFQPNHVEAWMRLECGTLDHLSAQHFRREVMMAVQCIEGAGLYDTERLADTYGLQS
jgi:hypothetical protein